MTSEEFKKAEELKKAAALDKLKEERLVCLLNSIADASHAKEVVAHATAT